MSEWTRTTLKKANIILIDCDHKTPKAQESGVPYIGIPQLKDGQIKFDLNPRLISEEDYVKWTSKANPQFNDIILSRRCNPGVTAFVPEGVKFALGQNLVLLRSVGSEVSPEYLRWLVQGRSWWGQVNKFLNSGAVFDSLKCRDIPNFEFNLPPLQEQKAIAKILGDLDAKIELNRKLNQTVEEMAQALFQSWFVDFDPVLDNAIAAGHEIPEALQVKAAKRSLVAEDKKLLNVNPELAEMFPNRFVFNEDLGKWIPEGWKLGKLNEVVEVKYGKDHKKLDAGEHPCFGSGGVMRYVDSTLCDDESVLIPRKGTLSNLMLVRKPFWSVDTMFFTKFKKENYAKFVFYFLQKFNFTEMNVGSAVPSMTTSVLNNIDLLQPSVQTLNLFEEEAERLLLRKESNTHQTETLTKLRDTLLPQLISGKLRVPEAMLKIQEATN